MPTRIAMWSGPRNISTAMMRSWDARPDTTVCDEPLYARYLKLTGADHPARDQIIQHHETDLDAVIARLLAPIPDGRDIFYQKHMAHHLLPDDDLDWTLQLTNCLLIRDPAEMIASYIKVIDAPTPESLALPQQLRLHAHITERLATPPPIIDARDVLENPRATLHSLCDAINVPFTDAMLTWQPGPRPTDGVWAKHWYANVERSTSFAAYKPKSITIPDHLQPALDTCNEIYTKLHAKRLTP